MRLTYKAINSQYAMQPSRPIWGGQGGVGSYYAAWICRFVSVDPLQFKYPHYTPYQYAGNKPISYIDLDGGEEKKPENEKSNETKSVDSYYMNDRGFWMKNDSNFGDYVGNVKPETDRYMELERINGKLYHKNTEVFLNHLGNKINSLLGGNKNLQIRALWETEKQL